MAKRKGKTSKRVHPRTVFQKSRSYRLWVLAGAVLVVAAGLVFLAFPEPPKPSADGPEFTKQGELVFVDGETGQIIQKIDIEIREDGPGRQEGMMWRRSMEEHQGMLFIMDRPEPQSFWMLNTFISLDMVFVDRFLRIINIRERTIPQSLDPQTSEGNALYVVEVVGGFSQKHGIKPGDRIRFDRM